MTLQTPVAADEARGTGGLMQDADQARVDDIVAGGPRGAIALCVLAVGVVLAVWLAFYLFIFLPRGTIA
jgi:hypothetical protein